MLEFQQPAQGVEPLILLVYEGGVLLVKFVTSIPHGFLQRVDGLGTKQMCFAFFAPLVFTSHIEGMTVDFPVGEGVTVA